MPVLISDALNEARAMLNDTGATRYTNTVLLPFIRKAYEEFQSWADSYNLYTVKRTAELVPDDVSGNYIILNYITTTPLLPSDMRIPVRLYEKASGEGREFYVLMEETEFKPVVSTTSGRTTYGYWNFDGNAIYLPVITPATRDVMIEYIGSTISFTDQTSTVYDIHFKTNLAARTAALAAMYIGQNESRAAAAQDDANTALDRILETMVRKTQGVFGARRINFGATRRIRESFTKWWS